MSPPKEGRYSKVSRRIWADERFLSLSAPPPNARDLFIRLLTAPEMKTIPGLFQIWVSGLAATLKWPVRGTQKALSELIGAGLVEYDDQSGTLWMPKALHHNEPTSPNVVRSWGPSIRELPPSSLKDKAVESLMLWATEKGEPWAKALGEALGKPFGKASPKPSRKASPQPSPNQEQEQEQEQEQDPPTPTTSTQELSDLATRAVEAGPFEWTFHRESLSEAFETIWDGWRIFSGRTGELVPRTFEHSKPLLLALATGRTPDEIRDALAKAHPQCWARGKGTAAALANLDGLACQDGGAPSERDGPPVSIRREIPTLESQLRVPKAEAMRIMAEAAEQQRLATEARNARLRRVP